MTFTDKPSTLEGGVSNLKFRVFSSLKGILGIINYFRPFLTVKKISRLLVQKTNKQAQALKWPNL